MNKKDRTKLLRLAAAIRDFSHAKNAASLFLRSDDEELRYHLFTSFVIGYTRPFTCNQGLGSLIGDYPEYSQSVSGVLPLAVQKQHSRFWEIRNSFVAHGEIAGLKLFLVPPNVASPVPPGLLLSDASFEIQTRAFLRPEFVEWLLEAVFAIENRVKSDFQPLLKEHAKGSRLIEIEMGADLFNWKR